MLSSLFGALPRYSSAYEGEDVTWRGNLNVHTPCKPMSKQPTNEVTRHHINEHVNFIDLHVLKDFLMAFRMVHFWTYNLFANYPDRKYGIFILEYICCFWQPKHKEPTLSDQFENGSLDIEMSTFIAFNFSSRWGKVLVHNIFLLYSLNVCHHNRTYTPFGLDIHLSEPQYNQKYEALLKLFIS
jgi:hypothetical protein